jgi:hypothetical protein
VVDDAGIVQASSVDVNSGVTGGDRRVGCGRVIVLSSAGHIGEADNVFMGQPTAVQDCRGEVVLLHWLRPLVESDAVITAERRIRSSLLSCVI